MVLAAPVATADIRVATIERLLAIPATDRAASLNEAAQLLVETFAAEKLDVFLLDACTQTLIAEGTSDTPMGREQVRLGLNRLPLANGGGAVGVFETGRPRLTRHADQEGELPGLVDGLGMRSEIIAPIEIGGVRRGVILASSKTPEYFAEEHLQFLSTVASWVGLVAERAELSEQLAAQAASSARRTAAEELIAVLAHDLRNHLAQVRGRIDLLRREARRAEHGQYVRQANAALHGVDRLAKLVDDLLDSERLERGLFTLRPETLDLAKLVREIAAPFQEEGALIHVEADDELSVTADPNRLRQCLENLLVNAARHSPPGGRINVVCEADRRGQSDGVRISIQDQGPGVPAELEPRLFERFARASPSGGLGLGLFLASRIAEAHGGVLWLDSAPNTPARFALWLPLLAAT